jgi:ribosomal protein S18 acetylase RimI-like enzyme
LLDFIDDIIVGTLMLSAKDEKTVQMKQVAVDTKYQNFGLGGKLIDFAENFAREKGFQLMYVHARKEAVNFYLKNGYEIVGEGFIEVNLPHFAVQKPL